MKWVTGKYAFMARGIVCCLALMSIIALAGCGSKSSIARAESVVDSLTKGDYTSVTNNFDANMKSAMSPATLGQVWNALTTQVGAFKSRTGSRTEKAQGQETVYVTCQFEKATLDVKLVFDGSNQISGMWIVPSQPVK